MFFQLMSTLDSSMLGGGRLKGSCMFARNVLAVKVYLLFCPLIKYNIRMTLNALTVQHGVFLTVLVCFGD